MVLWLLLTQDTRWLSGLFVQRELTSLQHHGTYNGRRQLRILWHDMVNLQEETVGMHHNIHQFVLPDDIFRSVHTRNMPYTPAIATRKSSERNFT